MTKFSRPFVCCGVWEDGEDLGEKKEYKGGNSGFYADYDTFENQELLLKVGISYVSVENARQNLKEEGNHWNFDQYVEDARRQWEEQLSKIQAEGADENLRKFYTCLYHVSLDPRTFIDCNGEYIAGSSIKQTDAFHCRTVFSGWDVYRSQFPLLTLIEPEVYDRHHDRDCKGRRYDFPALGADGRRNRLYGWRSGSHCDGRCLLKGNPQL